MLSCPLLSYELSLDSAILAEEKHMPIYPELVEKFDVSVVLMPQCVSVHPTVPCRSPYLRVVLSCPFLPCTVLSCAVLPE